ncbi:hypothetical protein PSH66_25765 [Pseudomonas sp. FP597]|uniref:hypothetical protein n=1 Tax=Pseudomonas sp. FP597 TaxID=2954096 RepID=UPI0027340848|nr:hypothetical protein [Pseudomonas sp. FP597]WLI05953.1 hypothetical protein PSH66_25765 [Pseudomonas sp. FP597]
MQRSSYGAIAALFIALAVSPAMAWAVELPAGYRLAQKRVTAQGSELQVLEDQRISAQMHKDNWGGGQLEDAFEEPDNLAEHPLLEARVRLVSASGEEIAQEGLGYPLAQIKKAPLKGLPEPVYFLTIDETAPMGTYSGPATQLLQPVQQQLKPMSYKSADGKVQPLTLAHTGKADWKVATPTAGGADELLQVSSFMEGDGEGEGDDVFTTRYQTYRFVDGQWQSASSQKKGYWDMESEFPARAAFP